MRTLLHCLLKMKINIKIILVQYSTKMNNIERGK